MNQEKREQIGVILNLVGNSNISNDLRMYCEKELKDFLIQLGEPKKGEVGEIIG